MGSRFIFPAFQKSQRIAILGLFGKIMNLKENKKNVAASTCNFYNSDGTSGGSGLWVEDSFFSQHRKSKNCYFKPFNGKILNLLVYHH
jgi:hypothetical protein